ncbi:MAG: PKD domain-containing protein [Saprospiraceae bacterium]|nr:PKD domain-containing protein [Saprospiraceae bacterium]
MAKSIIINAGVWLPYLFDIGDGNGLVPDRQFDFLPSGNYRITVSDANGCTNTQTVQVASSVAMSLNTTSTGTRCDGPTGTIRVKLRRRHAAIYI